MPQGIRGFDSHPLRNLQLRSIRLVGIAIDTIAIDRGFCVVCLRYRNVWGKQSISAISLNLIVVISQINVD
jgi:hypothetical protein